MVFKYDIHQQTPTTELLAPDLGQVHTENGGFEHVLGVQPSHTLNLDSVATKT